MMWFLDLRFVIEEINLKAPGYSKELKKQSIVTVQIADKITNKIKANSLKSYPDKVIM